MGFALFDNNKGGIIFPGSCEQMGHADCPAVHKWWRSLSACSCCKDHLCALKELTENVKPVQDSAWTLKVSQELLHISWDPEGYGWLWPNPLTQPQCNAESHVFCFNQLLNDPPGLERVRHIWPLNYGRYVTEDVMSRHVFRMTLSMWSISSR